MGKKYKISIAVIVAFIVVAVSVRYLKTVNIEVLNPKGSVAEKQRNLIIFASLLSLLVVIPVYILTFSFLFKYRDTNKNAVYTPDWDHNRKYETIWWGLPIVLILILSVVTWNSTHALDPAKPLDSDKKPLEVQVVALQWKWLFIYPEQNIATVNYLQIPAGRPINFSITSDAPMNSLWIPQLSGQIYAMSGMTTKLHLIADAEGVYNGSSANISGEGFAGMHFKVTATSESEFNNWVNWANVAGTQLAFGSYDELSKPTQNVWPATYSPVAKNLYTVIVDKYRLPSQSSASSESEVKQREIY